MCMSLRVYVHTFMCACVVYCLYVYAWTIRVCVCVCAFMFVCLCERMHAYLCVRLCLSARLCLSVCLCVCVCVCVRESGYLHACVWFGYLCECVCVCRLRRRMWPRETLQQHTATHCTTPHHPATYYKRLQQTATDCNTCVAKGQPMLTEAYVMYEK